MRLSDRENPGRGMGSSFAVRSKLDNGSVFAIVLPTQWQRTIEFGDGR